LHLAAIRELMSIKSFDGLAIVPGPNMEYLTGSKFHLSERPVVLFLELDKATFILPELESSKISNLGFDFIDSLVNFYDFNLIKKDKLIIAKLFFLIYLHAQN
jgi:Xaa-Pro aminopeptidase